MHFNSAYNLQCELKLTSGRTIILGKLTQSRVHAGLLEGTPGRRLNDGIIRDAVGNARRDSGGHEPLLICPNRRDYYRVPGDMQEILNRQQDRPEKFRNIPEWLPEVECVGYFSSTFPVRDQSKDGSALTVIWYQATFGIDQPEWNSILEIDWDRHATDVEY